jgi:hypothetical protein
MKICPECKNEAQFSEFFGIWFCNCKLNCLSEQPERPNPEAHEHKLVYEEPDPETMSPAMKAKYELAEKLTGCDGLNMVVMS